MNVLIIGVNGFVGQAVAAQLADRRVDVTGVSRSPVAAAGLRCNYVASDRNSSARIREIVTDRAIDVVVDVLAMTLADTQPLLDAVDGRVARYVMLSSCDVYRNYQLLHRRASGVADERAADEDADLRTTRYPYRAERRRGDDDPDRYLDDYDKIPIEQAVRRLGSDWVILRLPMIYGPGDRQRRFRWAVRHMARETAPLILPRGWSDWVTTYGFIDNVAGAITAATDHPHARNRVFNVAEPDPVSHLVWARRIAETMNWPGQIDVTDDAAHPMARQLAGLDLSVPFRIDGARIRRELGFQEATSIREGLRRTVRDEQARS